MPFVPEKRQFKRTINTPKTEVVNIDHLINGKDSTDRIVSVENKDGELYIYRQLEDGSIDLEKRPSVFWVVTKDHVDDDQIELKGNQVYKYMMKFSTQKERDAAVNICKSNKLDFYRIFNQKEQSLVYEGLTYYKGMKPTDVSVMSTDLETNMLQKTPESMILIISNTFRDHRGRITRKQFCIDDFGGDERAMIVAWIKWFRKMDPSILLAHNGFGFDLDYIKFRCYELGIKLTLGRDGSTVKFNPFTSKKRLDGSQDMEYYDCYIFGREIVDTMFLAITYDIGKAFPSNGLKAIVKHFGLEKEGRTFVDAAKIGRYYKDHLKGNSAMWKLSKLYAEEDSDDALKIFDVMVPAYFYLTNNVSKSFQGIINSATGSQLNNILVRAYLQMGHSIAKADDIGHIKGGISFAVPNIYRNLYKIDIKSCYPSQVLRFKLYDKNKDPFGFFYEMVKHFTYARFEYKKQFQATGDKHWKDLDAAAKVFINSAYGLTATTGLNYNAEWIGAKITEESRKVIDMALKWASGKESPYWFDLFHKKTGKKVDDPDDMEVEDE